MSEQNSPQSQPTTNSAGAGSWTGAQAYILAAFCLLLGVALGYLFRGSASVTQQAASSTPTQQGSGVRPQPADPAAQAALAQAAAPLVEAINKNPNDFDTLVKLGNLFYDGQQFPNAIQYYERALVIHPDNPDVRTDMGTAYWYTGNAEKALTAMETSLKYRPGHPQTLFNLGWVRWQGKARSQGSDRSLAAVDQGESGLSEKQQVEQYIAKAKEHASRG